MAETKTIYDFECHNPKTAAYKRGTFTARTPEECEEVAQGSLIKDSEPQAQSSHEDKTNVVSQRKRLASLSSPEAMAMGNDVAIGLSQRNFKGVIYAPQIDIEAHKENEGYDKYSDMHWRAIWSRHGGAFDIVVDYPAPMNNCRQANSNQPVNMDFYLDFLQDCCNERGPLMYHHCESQCWQHYLGPHLMDLYHDLGMGGHSIMKVNIHEAAARTEDKSEEEKEEKE